MPGSRGVYPWITIAQLGSGTGVVRREMRCDSEGVIKDGAHGLPGGDAAAGRATGSAVDPANWRRLRYGSTPAHVVVSSAVVGLSISRLSIRSAMSMNMSAIST